MIYRCPLKGGWEPFVISFSGWNTIESNPPLPLSHSDLSICLSLVFSQGRGIYVMVFFHPRLCYPPGWWQHSHGWPIERSPLTESPDLFIFSGCLLSSPLTSKLPLPVNVLLLDSLMQAQPGCSTLLIQLLSRWQLLTSHFSQVISLLLSLLTDFNLVSMTHDFNNIFTHIISSLAHLLPFVCTPQIKHKPGKTQLGAISKISSKQKKPTRPSQILHSQPEMSP